MTSRTFAKSRATGIMNVSVLIGCVYSAGIPENIILPTVELAFAGGTVAVPNNTDGFLR